MRKQFNFGKIDLYGRGRKVNAVDITVCLDEREPGRPVFTASGNIWNSKHTEVYHGGQCLDTIAKTAIGYNPTFKEIYRLWKSYHLNDMHAGTPKQEAEVKKFLEDNKFDYDYDLVCDHLRSFGLYEDNGYVYGSGWLYEAIPAEDLEKIKSLIEK